MFISFLIPVAAMVVLLVVVVLLVDTRPAEYRITRITKIAAPPAVVFAQVEDFHKWAAWSPWEKHDYAFKRTFAGAAAGTGAIYSWACKRDDIGERRTTITETRPAEFIRIKLEFIESFPAMFNTEYYTFTFKSEGTQTVVTWTMTRQNSIILKALHLLENMDKLLGSHFDLGLAQLKSVAEAEARRQA